MNIVIPFFPHIFPLTLYSKMQTCYYFAPVVIQYLKSDYRKTAKFHQTTPDSDRCCKCNYLWHLLLILSNSSQSSTA